MSYRNELRELLKFFRAVNKMSQTFIDEYYKTFLYSPYYNQFREIRKDAIYDLFREHGIQVGRDTFIRLRWDLMKRGGDYETVFYIMRSSVLRVESSHGIQIDHWIEIVNFAANYDILMKLLRPVYQEKAIRLKRILFGEDL